METEWDGLGKHLAGLTDLRRDLGGEWVRLTGGSDFLIREAANSSKEPLD